MGCWNETCAVSRLPIFEDDPVVGVLLVDMGGTPGFATTSAFAPIGLPIRGAYNDYGGIKDVEWSPWEKHAWSHPEGFLSGLVLLEQGENPFHDHAMSFDVVEKGGWEALATAMQSSRLLISTSHYEHPVSGLSGTQPTPQWKKSNGRVILSLIHARVWDALIEASPLSEEKASRQIYASRDLFGDSEDKYGFNKKIKRHPMIHDFLCDESSRGLGLSKISVYAVVSAHEDLCKQTFSVNSSLPPGSLEEFEEQSCSLLRANEGLRVLRRYWQPGAVTSQESDLDVHLEFQQVLTGIAREKSRQFGEADEDDDVIPIAPRASSPFVLR
jgi:hypothetical protein